MRGNLAKCFIQQRIEICLAELYLIILYSKLRVLKLCRETFYQFTWLSEDSLTSLVKIRSELITP